MSRGLEHAIAQTRNAIYQSMGEAGQRQLENGLTLTWNPCTDPQYRNSRFRYVSLTGYLDGDKIHKTGIFDVENSRFVD